MCACVCARVCVVCARVMCVVCVCVCERVCVGSPVAQCARDPTASILGRGDEDPSANEPSYEHFIEWMNRGRERVSV